MSESTVFWIIGGVFVLLLIIFVIYIFYSKNNNSGLFKEYEPKPDDPSLVYVNALNNPDVLPKSLTPEQNERYLAQLKKSYDQLFPTGDPTYLNRTSEVMGFDKFNTGSCKGDNCIDTCVGDYVPPPGEKSTMINICKDGSPTCPDEQRGALVCPGVYNLTQGYRIAQLY